jgi:outer membrane autotransporter protein
LGGPPTDLWPFANCDYTGYQQLVIEAGTLNVNVNTHSDTSYAITLAPDSAGQTWLSGDLHTAFHNILIDDGGAFLDQLLGRGGVTPSMMFSPEPMAFFGGGMSSPALDQTAVFAGSRAHVEADIGAWFAVLPRASRYDGTAGNFGFSSAGVAIAGGIDQDSGSWRYGVGFSLDATGVVQDTTADSGRIATARLGAYGSYDLGDWDVAGAIALGLHRIDTTRLSMLPVPSTASYSAASLSAGLEARGHYDVDPFLLEPTAGIVYTATASEAFTETGPLGIAGAADTTPALKVYAGGEASMELVGGNGRTWTPSLRGRLLYDLLDDPRAFTASFVADPAATPFIVSGISPSRLAAMVGAAIEAETGSGLTLEASYDLTLRGGALAHQASAGARGTF